VRLDYLGILLMILFSFVSALHFGFYCKDDMRAIYISIIIILCVAGAIVTQLPVFQRPTWAILRGVVFALIVSYSVIPLAV
jgi:adiponectin receptor